MTGLRQQPRRRRPPGPSEGTPGPTPDDAPSWTAKFRQMQTGSSSDDLAGPQFGQKVSSTIEPVHLDVDGTDVAQCVGVRARAGRGAQQVAKLSCPRIGP